MMLHGAAMELHGEDQLQRHGARDGERIRGLRTLPMTFSYLDSEFLKQSREDPSHGSDCICPGVHLQLDLEVAAHGGQAMRQNVLRPGTAAELGMSVGFDLSL